MFTLLPISRALRIIRRLDRIESKINYTLEAQGIIMTELDDLKTATDRLGTEVSEAVAKIKELADKLLAAIHDDLEGKELKLAVTKAATDINAAADKLDAASGDFQASGN